MIARRSLLAAAPALTLARPALAAPSRDIAVRGSKAYSESAMVMSVSADGSSAIALRICRFPVEGFTWLWCHVLKDGVLYAFTSHDLPCTADRLAGTPQATYAAPPMDAALIRTGRGAGLSDVRLKAALPFHRSRTAPHGAGRVPGRLEGRFTPTRALVAPVNAGRDEVYGTFKAEVVIRGRSFIHEGAAKFHEQRQEAARFDTPFSYGWLAGPGAASTLLLGPRGASGGRADRHDYRSAGCKTPRLLANDQWAQPVRRPHIARTLRSPDIRSSVAGQFRARDGGGPVGRRRHQ